MPTKGLNEERGWGFVSVSVDEQYEKDNCVCPKRRTVSGFWLTPFQALAGILIFLWTVETLEANSLLKLLRFISHGLI